MRNKPITVPQITRLLVEDHQRSLRAQAERVRERRRALR
jgi:hypothetical protein